jgi:hypothetical protein
MKASYSIGSWHWCNNISAEAVAINDDGTESSADHLKVFVRDTDGEMHEALCVYLPIDLARNFAKAINEVSATQTEMNIPVMENSNDRHV